jgi:NlpC/P60 family putative phage cell wall peptidase
MPTLSRADLLTEALSWRETPYHAQASIKGLGADCIGFVIGVAKNIGLLDPAYTPGTYSAEWHLHQHEERLRTEVEQFGCVARPLGDRIPGDLLLFQFGRVCAHSGLLLPEEQVIHAVRDYGRVLVTSLRGEWLTRLRYVYCFPGMD